MTYPVFLYNMLLAATYVVLAVVFFWLHRSRSSRLAWWLMILSPARSWITELIS